MGFSDMFQHSPFCVMNVELLLLFSDYFINLTAFFMYWIIILSTHSC